MFHHHHSTEVSVVATPRSTVRLLETDEDLRAAVERASAFERRGAVQGTRRALSYERYLDRTQHHFTDMAQVDTAEVVAS
jgi:hypothetical protein